MSFEDEMRSALANFVVEADDLLVQIEFGLLALEEGGDDAETVNSVFRAAHTIKGSSGLFGLDHLVRFTHVMESVLNRLRDGEIPVSADLIGALLPCTDHLRILVGGVAEQGELAGQSAEQEAAGQVLLAGLGPFLSGPAPGASDGSAPSAGHDPQQGLDEASGGMRDVHLSLRFGPDSLRNGMDPLSFIRYLSSLGEVVSVTPMTGLIPAADQMDPETCYLGFEVTLRTGAEVVEIEGVFDFVREDSDIRVLVPASPASEYVSLIESYGPLAPVISDVLVRAGAIRAPDLAAAIQSAADGVPAVPSADVPAPRASSPDVQEPAQRRSAAAGRRATDQNAGVGSKPERAVKESQTIRVDADRLDRLIDGVGELVIAGAGAGLRASLSGDELLEAAVGEVMRLVEEVRDSALQLRMVPIGSTFSRFQRVVRDVSAALGKDVALVVNGGDTEVDKALVEQIGDPLMHLVRNALDHGVESAAERASRGKPARGTLRLNAFHDSGSIVIEVQDDGGGIDADRVLAKAVQSGLADPNNPPTRQEIFGLIFEPGFSTADQVSDLSGRGVGMDVVKRNVTALRGTIDVDSTPGEGTTFRIRLPLTLAIIDGFMVGVGGATFVIPLDRVVECVELPASERSRGCMDLRGEVLPFIRLRSLFDIGDERPRRENVVVVEYAGTKTGLVVDSLKGEFQTVIKPLGSLFAHVQGIGGSTILGNGDVALIIDVPMLVLHASRPEGVLAPA